MLVDIATVYYRAYFSTPDSMLAPDGRPVNAVRGSLDALLHLIEKYRPNRLAVCWDLAWRPEWRVAELPSYKTARVAGPGEEQMPDTLSDQVDLLRAVLDELGVQNIGLEEHEADDLVAHYSRSETGLKLVVSGDRDLFQLVSDEREVRMLYLGTGVSKHTVADDTYLVEKYGIPPGAYGEFSVLRGDASDGLPGVRGIGEKTAAALLRDFGGLDALLAAAQARDPRLREKVALNLLEHADYIERARRVVLLERELDLPALTSDWLRPGGSETLRELGLPRYENRWQQVVAGLR